MWFTLDHTSGKGIAVLEEHERAVDFAGVAAILCCSVDKVRSMAKSGEIPGFRVGKLWRFFPSEVITKLNAPKDPWVRSAAQQARRRRAA